MLLLLMLINFALLLQQAITPPDGNVGGWFQYGIAGVLAVLLGYLIKYIIQRDKHDQELAKERSGMYREDNRIRDQRFIDALKSIDIGGERFVEATNSNIEKFVSLVNRVMEQSTYQTQTLVELKTIVSKLPSEFQALKTDINDHLEKLVMSYDLTKKEDN